MALFTRESVYLKWNGDATEKAFRVLKADYGGAEEQKQASYARSQYDNSLLAVRASTNPRRFTAQLVGEDSPSGADGGIDYGSIADLRSAWIATDLKCQSFEDAAYWTAEWTGSWIVIMEYDPVRNYVVILCSLEGKA